MDSYKNPNKYHYVVNEDGSITTNIEYILNVSNTKSVKDVNSCNICLEEESSIVTICDHQYCKNCIQKWLNVKEKCPYCRQKLLFNNFFYIKKK